jgi:homoaconitase/3-isopropylmalate dehydratase large subunit
LPAVADHNVPTTDRSAGIADPVSRLQVETLDKNCAEFGITEFGMTDLRQGIVHVVGPEQGATLPGMTVVCGDSQLTPTHPLLCGQHDRPKVCHIKFLLTFQPVPYLFEFLN